MKSRSTLDLEIKSGKKLVRYQSKNRSILDLDHIWIDPS